MEDKQCTKCKKIKPIKNYYKDKQKKDGYSSKCKTCFKEYNKLNKEYRRKYNLENKDIINKYYLDNKEYILNNSKQYYLDNKKKINLYTKQYYLENKEKALNYAKDYLKENRDKINKYTKNYSKLSKCKKTRSKRQKERYKNDITYRNECIIRSLININFKLLLNGKYIKSKSTEDILGCSFEEFKNHLKSKFEPWMSWDNQGNPKDGIFEPNKTWDIDHIIPTSSAKTEEEIYKLNHFSNLQPLCSYNNRFIKKDNE